MQKNRAIWPLPGGTTSYIETLDALLEKVSSSRTTREDLVKWFIDTFDTVSSTKTTTGYIMVTKNMGLIDFENGNCILTEAGKKYFKSKDRDFLFRTISDHILAFEEIYEFHSNSNEPRTDQEIFEFIRENFSVEWTTLFQVNFRLLWLMNLGKVAK